MVLVCQILSYLNFLFRSLTLPVTDPFLLTGNLIVSPTDIAKIFSSIDMSLLVNSVLFSSEFCLKNSPLPIIILFRYARYLLFCEKVAIFAAVLSLIAANIRLKDDIRKFFSIILRILANFLCFCAFFGLILAKLLAKLWQCKHLTAMLLVK